MIGKITRQELHPTLIGQINDIYETAFEAYDRPTVIISVSEPEEAKDGTLWFNVMRKELYIRYNGEWIPISSSCGGVVTPDYSNVTINREFISIVGKKEYVEIPGGITNDETMKIFANGLLLKENHDYIKEGNKIYRFDGKDWNQESANKTHFMFINLTFDHPYITTYHEVITTNKNPEHIIIPKVLDKVERANLVIFVNKVKMDESKYIVEDDRVVFNTRLDDNSIIEIIAYSLNYDVLQEHPITIAPKINKYQAKNIDATNVVSIPFDYSDKNYYEVIANGVYIYPNQDYILTENTINKMDGKWDPQTTIDFIEISDINIVK